MGLLGWGGPSSGLRRICCHCSPRSLLAFGRSKGTSGSTEKPDPSLPLSLCISLPLRSLLLTTSSAPSTLSPVSFPCPLYLLNFRDLLPTRLALSCYDPGLTSDHSPACTCTRQKRERPQPIWRHRGRCPWKSTRRNFLLDRRRRGRLLRIWVAGRLPRLVEAGGFGQ